jgi:PKD repeat protein
VTTPVPNAAPVADFKTDCHRTNCSFTDRSTDRDGTVVAWSWSFGDGTTASTRSPSHTFPAKATYTVALTVTDNQGATNRKATQVKVSNKHFRQ